MSGKRVFVPLMCLLPAQLVFAAASSYVVRSRGIAVHLLASGEVSGIDDPGRQIVRNVHGGTMLEGCATHGSAAARKLSGGGMEFRRLLVHADGHQEVTLTERFIPASNSVRWEIELAGGNEPWTTPIQTRLRYPVSPAVKFWAPWSDPDQGDGKVWHDPLAAAPLKSLKLWYGAPPFRYDDPLLGFTPFRGDLISIPMASFLEPDRDFGVTVVLSPEDTLLDLTVDTTAQGDLVFSRLFHRLGGTRPLKFALDLTTHEADWRGGLRWMSGRYPPYFNPTNPAADELAGTGAYSATETPFDAEKMRKMAFRTNWKASFDFPYMGMFLPPVPDDREWNRYSYDTPAADPDNVRVPNGRSSIRQMAAYSRNMRAQGFYVLSYFNVTEFGALIRHPAPPPRYTGDDDLWRDANDFLYRRLQSAILRVSKQVPADKLKFYPGTTPGGPYFTWGDAVVMDCGEPVYRDFLLEQAKRHIEKIPDASGICIDRMDWLRLYNEDRDDGISWFCGRPARSLLSSWNALLAQLGPMMHGAGKAIFVNNHDKRIDLLRHVDGFFDEFTYAGAPLNLTAFLAIRRPALGWTSTENDLKPDPDAFFQKYLHMGVYPMAPFPGNDHSLLPSEWVDRWYLDYGPLLDRMRGRKWVMAPHAAEVEGGGAKVNLFEVPGGYAVPVTHGGTASQVRVILRGLRPVELQAEAFHPGSDKPAAVQLHRLAGKTVVEVPLKRGCTMLLCRRREK